jgi:large subunit ribosomal protein L18
LGIKNTSRLRRARKTRLRIKDQDLHRLTVYKSSKHFYAQIFDSSGSTVVASASTNEKDSDLKIMFRLLKKLVKQLLKEQ